ncbi:MAG: hypothetical protein BMS9Abin01_1013 [Gammaproteobacteria bacterium]|nr:MAG: hypothetical protein BMS9Abin01_1013 [Gammaproteobacteria bacterium]
MRALKQPVNSCVSTPSVSIAEHYLKTAVQRLVVVRRTLASYGRLPLRDYLTRLSRFRESSCQGRADLFEAVRDYASPLLGEGLAERAANDLAHTPVVLTANHHGVDFFAQSLQSSLAFALRESDATTRPSTVPVFACGAIPLNNLTYPRGMLIYRGSRNAAPHWPIKLPVFPDRCRHDLVSDASGFDKTMLHRTGHRVQRLVAEGRIAWDLQSSLQSILQTDYADPSVLAEHGYSEQAVMLNQRIWKRLFRNPEAAPDLVYLEIEKIAARLLRDDLANTSSLAWRVLFEREVRDSVLADLDGQRACWDLSALHARAGGGATGSGRPSAAAGCGTVFFWGIDGNKRRIPLSLRPGNPGMLVGVGEHGERSEMPLEPTRVCTALKEQELLPSLFTSYLCIALARGVNCVGGYYQAEYLPVMQHAVAGALSKCGRGTAVAEEVSLVPTTAYLSGMQTVMGAAGDAALLPAGVFEIIAGGGLDEGDLTRMGELSVRDAHLASVADTVLDVAADTIDSDRWQERLGVDLRSVLGNRIVVK